MSKRTLLQIVQEALSEGDGDEVNSISDTVESEQIAEVARSHYEAMMVNRDWPHTRQLVQLTASGDNSFPNYMTLPANIKKLVTVNYDAVKSGETRKTYQPIKYLGPDEFLMKCNSRDSGSDSVDTIIDPSGVSLLIDNSKSPNYYTSFDDETMIFDSYDSAVENTLQASKIQVIAYIFPTFSVTDNFIPDLPVKAFPLFIEEVKSKAAIKFRQVQDPKAEQEAGRQSRWMSRNDWQVAGGIKYPDFGRKSARRRTRSNSDGV